MTRLEPVGLVARQGLVEPAPAQSALVGGQGLHAVALRVVPLDLAGDDGEAGQVALSVVVLVTLLRLPAEQALLGDSERAGERQAVSRGSVADEPLSDFGTLIRVSCISTTVLTASPMSAGAICAPSQPDQSSGANASPFHSAT